jgi:hypothetical protein
VRVRVWVRGGGRGRVGGRGKPRVRARGEARVRVTLEHTAAESRNLRAACELTSAEGTFDHTGLQAAGVVRSVGLQAGARRVAGGGETGCRRG